MTADRFLALRGILKDNPAFDEAMVYLNQAWDQWTDTESGTLARFAGRWQDTRPAEEIVAELRADRDSNQRSDKRQW